MLRLALCNLIQSKSRLVVSIAGVGLALALILTLDAILVGTQGQITSYIDHSGADVFVSQPGVRTLHMASSALPIAVVDKVRDVPGVASATPILYLSTMIVVGRERALVYLIGLPPDASVGRPWLVEGTAIPALGEAVIDRGVAAAGGVGIGDSVTILGRGFTVSGLSAGTASLVNSIAFISFADFARLRGDGRTVSFVLIEADSGISPDTLATRIEALVGGVTAQSRRVFADQERRIVRDMSTDLVGIMNLAGFLIGLAVMALTIYTATLARSREYGLLKALGARTGHLYRTVLAQAVASVGLGFALGLAFTLLVSGLAPRVGTNLALEVSGASLLKVGGLSLVIAGISAILPIWQIARLDPAMVYRRR